MSVHIPKIVKISQKLILQGIRQEVSQTNNSRLSDQLRLIKQLPTTSAFFKISVTISFLLIRKRLNYTN
jgi:hypothetical protein